MSIVKRVCVYCGSNQGRDPRFVTAARRFGEILAANRIGLVYGGGSTGLMGTVAGAVRDHGGEIIGVIPEFLKAKERSICDSRARSSGSTELGSVKTCTQGRRAVIAASNVLTSASVA